MKRTQKLVTWGIVILVVLVVLLMLVSNLLTSLLNLHRLLHVTGLRVQWMRWVIKPVFSFLCAGAACRFVLQPLTQRLGLPLLAWAALFTRCSSGLQAAPGRETLSSGAPGRRRGRGIRSGDADAGKDAAAV